MGDQPLFGAFDSVRDVMVQTHLGHAWAFGAAMLLAALALTWSSQNLLAWRYLVLGAR